jgi:hypothetical protein
MSHNEVESLQPGDLVRFPGCEGRWIYEGTFDVLGGYVQVREVGYASPRFLPLGTKLKLVRSKAVRD